ncbi:MAG: tetratricopeptide repeat protein [Pseudohongiella sp.]|nr:tetratricopeptide repeat protein [Pseudohongiella sp.]
MSLLMEALRKAEEAKRRVAQESERETETQQPELTPVAEPFLPIIPAEENTAKESVVSETGDHHADLDFRFDDLETQQSDPVSQTPQNSGSLDIPLGFHLDVDEPLRSTEREDVAENSTDISASAAAAVAIVEPPEPAPAVEQTGASKADIFASIKLVDLPDATVEKSLPDFLLEPQTETPGTTSQESIGTNDVYASESPAQTDALMREVSQQIHQPEAPVKAAADDPVVQTPSFVMTDRLESGVSADGRIIEKVIPERYTDEPRSADKAGGARKSDVARQSARAMFAAKAGAQTPDRKRLIVWSSVAALVAIVCIGAFLWVSTLMNSGSQFNVPANFDASAYQALEAQALAADNNEQAPVSETESPEPALAEPEVAEISVATAAPVIAAIEVPVETSVATPVAVAEATADQSPIEQSRIEPVVTTAPVPSTSTPTQMPTVASTIIQTPAPMQISRSEPMRNPDMQMLSAWSAYQQGDYAASRILYQQSLARDPDNRDALLGVAASAVQQGDMATARQAYTKLLTLNPRDPLARTGLLDTTNSADPMQREIDLKALLSDYPGIAAISYSLGNLYASQQRWHDAQQAYYNALLTTRTQAAGPVNPDYAFNLAISLERINQPQAALNFYKEALTLSEQHPPGFDMQILHRRLQALERSSP